MRLDKLSLYWHTVRYLRLSQILGRVAHVLGPMPRVDPRVAPPLRARQNAWRSIAWRQPAIAEGRIHFVGIERPLMPGAECWNNPTSPKLWLYNLHYFDDLDAMGAEGRQEVHAGLLHRWVAENPVGVGNGWEPYCLSLRTVNWIKWFAGGHPPQLSWINSLDQQLRFLCRRLEWHLLGNHLWANAKALVFGGVFFDGPEARSWLTKGLGILDRQLDEQILADGGHFERSPMYHAILLEDLLDLIQLSDCYPDSIPAKLRRRWSTAVTRMLAWLQAMSHPDGDIALMNDAAFGIAPVAVVLERYARQLGCDAVTEAPAVALLPATGYARLTRGPAVLLADVGEIGPDYLPGHAHADTLGFELSLYGQRLIVDSGTSRYDASPERLRQRATAAHNTVEIDRADSSEVWSSFRVARRARPLDVSLEVDATGEVRLSASHDGYRRLPGKPLHSRQWLLRDTGLEIRDRIQGRYSVAFGRVRLHPCWILKQDGPQTGTAHSEGRHLRWSLEGAGEVRLTPATWHPRFGASETCTLLEWTLPAGSSLFRLDW